MIGLRFGRWLVLSEAAGRRNGKRLYLCRCDCGTESVCIGSNLRSGTSKSCGCHKKQRIHETKFRHGRNGKDPTYSTWNAMHSRCNNPNTAKYARYGGRGIKVCERWRSFENFLADMGERPPGKTLDRWPNQDGNYEPGNCRWATSVEQRRNNSQTRPITAFGETKLLTDWAKERGFPPLVIWKRIARGWTVERALTEPLRINKLRKAA